MLPNAWYVLCYHDVGWSEHPMLRGLGLTHPTDVFGSHVAAVADQAELLGWREALDAFQAGRLSGPVVTFSFDDGYQGVGRYAAPILSEAGTTGLAAINPPFTDGETTFWRSQLCWLASNGHVELVAAELGVSPDRVRDQTMDRFDLKSVARIDEMYRRLSDGHPVVNHNRLYMSWDEIVELQREGWEIANHSSDHYPLLEASGLDQTAEQFERAEVRLREKLGAETTVWVAPFDRSGRRAPGAVEWFGSAAGSRHIVLVGDEANQPSSATTPEQRSTLTISRINPPLAGANSLLESMARAALKSKEIA